MTTVLVTGADGQLGQCIQNITHQFPSLDFLFADRNTLDITVANDVLDFFETNAIDWCINCAAYTFVDKAETEIEKARIVNVVGTQNLAKACKVYDVKLIHISTDFVFDGKKNVAYTENEATDPLNIYGRTKLQGELEISSILKQHYILRTSWLYSEFGHNFMLTILRLSKENKELKIVDDQIGRPTYAGDLAKFIMQLIVTDTSEYGIYNYCNEGIASWYDFAKAIVEISKINIKVAPISSDVFPTRAKRPTFSVLDNTKAKEVFNSKLVYWRDSLVVCLRNLNSST